MHLLTEHSNSQQDFSIYKVGLPHFVEAYLYIYTKPIYKVLIQLKMILTIPFIQNYKLVRGIKMRK